MIWSLLVKLTYSCIPYYNTAYHGNWGRVSALRSDTLDAVRMVLHSHWAHVARSTEGNSSKCADYPQHCQPIQFWHRPSIASRLPEAKTELEESILWCYETCDTYCRNVHTKRLNKDTYGTTRSALLIPSLFTAAASISAYFDSLKHIYVCQL